MFHLVWPVNRWLSKMTRIALYDRALPVGGSGGTPRS
jgi:hypothetical protein